MYIRSMTAADKPAVMQILENTPEFNALDRKVAEEVIDAFLFDPASGEYHTYVAELDSQIAGYVCYGHNTMTVSTWDIYWIAVSSASQGKGIGRELMAMAENNIQKAGGKLIIVETSSTPVYDRTNRFYQKLNYFQACRIADFYSPGDDQILYIKRF
jgi:ribosomal protein S18 acetylase RimI-like enzyme